MDLYKQHEMKVEPTLDYHLVRKIDLPAPGGLSYFTEGKNTTTPNSEAFPVEALIAEGAETNIDAALVPKGYGSILAQIPDGSYTGGGRRGNNSVDFQTSRNIASQAATGSNAFIGGGSRNTVSQNYSAVLCGFSNTVSGQYASICGGGGNQATANYSICPGGYGNKAHLYGQFVYSGYNNFGLGQSQTSVLHINKQTTDNTESECFLDTTSARVVLPSNYAWTCNIKVTAVNVNNESQSASFERKCLIYNYGGTVALEGTVQTVGTDIVNSNLSGISIGISADDTNNSLKCTSTGLAGTTIRWTWKIELVEIGG